MNVDAALAPSAHGRSRSHVEQQFDDLEQQRDASNLGMWVFLTTETLFFGALFFGYAVSRTAFPEAFAAASRHTSIVLGTINTAVLLTSSFTMALAVRFANARRRRMAAMLLAVTAALGLAFAGIKLTEYGIEYREHLVPTLDFAFAPEALKRGAELFFWLYFTSTGLHLAHLSIGIAIVVAFAAIAWRSRSTDIEAKVEAVGLYWHFVDLVWIFLYPCLYLVART
jgi:cytochrome c oxidase subunit 3